MMASEPPQGRYHRPDDDHRKGGATAGGDPSLGKLLLADVRKRYRRNPRRTAGIAVGSALLIATGHPSSRSRQTTRRYRTTRKASTRKPCSTT